MKDCVACAKRDGAAVRIGEREFRGEDVLLSGGMNMTTFCIAAITLAILALGLASYPYLHSFWEHHSRRARWHRRLEMVKHEL